MPHLDPSSLRSREADARAAACGVLRRLGLWVTAAAVLCSLGGAAIATSPATGAAVCGFGSSTPLWIDYGEGSLTPDVRAVFARPGVIVSTSGTAVPAAFRAAGAQTTYFVRNLPALVGQPSDPADPASIPAAAAKLLATAAASTGCTDTWIALNEMAGSGAVPPWSATTAVYRADILQLMQLLTAGGAQPALLVHGDPYLGGTAADWWRSVAQAGAIVYEAYYDAPNIYSLGPLMGNRRMRLGIRGFVTQYQKIGILPSQLGVMLGFHSAQTPGIAGRQGLEPREAWFRVVKWEALAAEQVAKDTKIESVWSWGWGTFGPESVDTDKADAGCVYLWARDQTLCDGPAAGGPAFDTSLTEGQILPGPYFCTLEDGRVAAAAVNELAALTRSKPVALTALFARVTLLTAAPVTAAQVLAVERGVIARSFGGSRKAYLAALRRRHATVEIARGVILDELRRDAIAAMLTQSGSEETVLQWTDDVEAARADTAICYRDLLPGTGNFPQSNAREIGVVPLPALLPFLFKDRTPPAASTTPTIVLTTGKPTLTWDYGTEKDLAGYEVFRAATSGGPYTRLTTRLLARPTFTDSSAPAGTPSYYVVRAVDTSGNESGPSGEAATPTAGG